jgi:hypothetical protein
MTHLVDASSQAGAKTPLSFSARSPPAVAASCDPQRELSQGGTAAASLEFCSGGDAGPSACAACSPHTAHALPGCVHARRMRCQTLVNPCRETQLSRSVPFRVMFCPPGSAAPPACLP